LFVDNAFRMWYNGGNTDSGIAGIGYATSTDGIVWTKNAAPVLMPGLQGA
jgi:hypothetical protein